MQHVTHSEGCYHRTGFPVAVASLHRRCCVTPVIPLSTIFTVCFLLIVTGTDVISAPVGLNGDGCRYIPDSSFSVNGFVRAVHIYGGVVYIGGSFTRVFDAEGEYERTNCAAYSLDSRRVLPFCPKVESGYIRAITAEGRRLFIGGTFKYVNDVFCSKIAVLDTGSGACVEGFRPGGGFIDQTVNALVYTSGKLFAGGNFTTVDECDRNGFAAFNGETGEVDLLFDPSPGDPADFDGKLGKGLRALAVHPLNENIIFAGGNFRTMFGSSDHRFLTAVTSTGMPGPRFERSSRHPVIALDGHDNVLYAGLAGYGNRAAAWEVGSGSPYKKLWSGFVVEGDVQAVAATDNGLVYFGFHQGLVDTTDLYRVAVLDGSNGSLFDTLPSMNSFFGVWALATDGNVLATGGTFTRIGSRRHPFCAVFSLPDYPDALPLGPVQLLTPAEGDTLSDSRIRFTWYLSSFAKEYELQIATDSGFERIVAHEPQVPDLDKWVFLPGGGRYWWRVRGVQGGRRGEWSAARKFIIRPGFQDVPLFVVPDGRNDLPVSFSCVWNSAASADAYRLQLSQVWDFSDMLCDTVTTDTSILLTGLSPDSEYYLQIQGLTGWGATEWNAMRFSTLKNAPDCMETITPVQGAHQVSCHPHIIWNSPSTVSRCCLQLALDKGFTGNVVDTVLEGTSFFTAPELALSTEYFWRVIVDTEGGACTTAVQTFITRIPYPSPPVLQFPLAGYVANDDSICFYWEPGDNSVFQYRVQCEYLFNSSTNMVLDSIVTDTLMSVSGLDDRSAYSWHVKAENASGWSEFSPSIRFNTLFPRPSPDEPPAADPHGDAEPSEIRYSTSLSAVLFKGGAGNIRYELAEKGRVVFTLHTLQGIPVWERKLSVRESGFYSEWYSLMDVATGLYYLRMQSDSGVKTVKAVVLR